ncbi:hypothetical protein PSTG_16713 [Puccinia striiformis f. sp. tritici PST-78]|uniref:Choline kinase N-terminal domain-containing protein n=1 Tax=Puccinia striiformis f. sp. tritici PST-78 TaxID=1165861 RepID=A0A0L0USB2_9BASI|nr:hypothetical protein PSTG_16713 [Puccinia striiformis f. sp. tritici PST-78]
MQASVGLELMNPGWTHSIHNIKPQPSASVAGDEDSLSDLEDGNEPPVEYSAEPVHAEGVPRSDTKLSPKNYRTREFGATVFELLRSELKLPGWSNLSDQDKTSIAISKVSGSLTNAVFFVTCSASTQQANQDQEPLAPTVLLRIYGPSSGTLISRKEELHLLHTLSATYGIGPLLLGTFNNGRVEQFFKSRPLSKEEVREPQISTWIARKMAELHSVDLSTVINSDHQDFRAHSQSSCRANSLSSDSKWAPPASITSPSIKNSASPLTTPHLRSLNHTSTREGQRTLSLNVGSKTAKAGVWNNITRWQHEATKVFVDISKALDKLGIQSSSNSLQATSEDDPLERFRATPSPLSSPQALAELFKIVDLPRLIIEMKSYRTWIYNHEKIHGKSLRVFSHNDTQPGNLLLRQDDDPTLREQPQDQIMVIDFEYASANPRGFDIANHFHEWCADYHHTTHSYSLTRHGKYPTYQERQRFYKAYLGLDDHEEEEEKANSTIKRFKDCEIDDFNLDEPDESEITVNITTSNKITKVSQELGECEEDSKVIKELEEDVNLWSPASHAMWALWGLVQARDDLKVQLDRWLNNLHLSSSTSDSCNNVDEFEFDYFSYSAERIILFRKLLADLNVPILA